MRYKLAATAVALAAALAATPAMAAGGKPTVEVEVLEETYFDDFIFDLIIRDAGWVRVVEDGLVVRGPHPFLLETDAADVYC